MNNKKKNIERIYAKWLVDQLGMADCEIVDDECPDFGLYLHGESFGLEITCLYKNERPKGFTKKQVESFRGKWISEVADIYYKKSKIPINVKILIKHGGLNLPPKTLAEELVRHNSIEVLEAVKIILDTSDKCTLKIFLRRLPLNFGEYKHWSFVDNHVGWSRPIENTVIQKIIADKASKLSSYHRKYNQVNLLIIANRSNDSGMFHLDNETTSLAKCGFSSIYLGLYPENCVKIA